MMNLLSEIDPKVLDENVFKLNGAQTRLRTSDNAAQFSLVTSRR